LDFWTPNINPFRDPRWGRGQETPGEDPYHLSSYVHALIQGLQGEVSDPYKRVVATCKHFAGYDIEDWNGNLRYATSINDRFTKLTTALKVPVRRTDLAARLGGVLPSKF